MQDKRPYEPPAIIDSGSLIEHDTAMAVPLSRAIAIALAYAIKDKEPSIAALIHPTGAKLSWYRLPEWIQDRFYAICAEFGIGEPKRRVPWNALTRDERSVAAMRDKLFR